MHIFYTAVADLSDLLRRESHGFVFHAIHKQMDREARGEIKTWCKPSSADMLCSEYTHVQCTVNSSSLTHDGRPVMFAWDSTSPLH